MSSRDKGRAIARRLARDAAEAGESFEWFERLYSMAERGEVEIPWANGEPNPWLAELFGRVDEAPARGARTLCVGCGTGDDAEWLASLGLRVTAFDIAPTAIDQCRRRFPGSAVDYVTANLLAPPDEWIGAFDLVVEANTLQVVPGELRAAAFERLSGFLAPAGALYLIARFRDDDEPTADLPWPLTRDDLTIPIHDHRLRPVILDDFTDTDEPAVLRVMACFRR